MLQCKTCNRLVGGIQEGVNVVKIDGVYYCYHCFHLNSGFVGDDAAKMKVVEILYGDPNVVV